MEAMTAAVILGIGVLATSSVYTAGSRGRSLSRKRDTAVYLVEQRLETLVALGVESLPNCTGARGCKNPTGGLRSDRASDGNYPCTQIVHEGSLVEREKTHLDARLRLDTHVWPPAAGEQDANGRLVEISACWLNARGDVKTYTAHRLVLPRGI